MRHVLTMLVLWLCSSCASVQPEVYTLTFMGTYQPVADHQDPISCYCARSGYLNVCGNQLIPLCLEQVPPIDSCQDISVEGYYEYFQPSLQADVTCPEVEQRLLVVTAWYCRGDPPPPAQPK